MPLGAFLNGSQRSLHGDYNFLAGDERFPSWTPGPFQWHSALSLMADAGFLMAIRAPPLWQLAPPFNQIVVSTFSNGSYHFLTGDHRFP